MDEDKVSLLYNAIASKFLLAALCFNIIVLIYKIGLHWRIMTAAQAAVTVLYITTTLIAMAVSFMLGPIAGLALSTCWLAFSIGQVLSFGVVNGFAFKATTSTLTDRDDDEGQIKLTHTMSEPVTTKMDIMHQDIEQDAVGSFLSETRPTEESQLEEKHEQTNLVPDTLGRHVSLPKLGVTLGLLLLAAIVLPIARAEPTRTSTPDASLTLPEPTPHVTTFNAVAAVNTANISVDTQEKDKPQTWFYHPNSSQRTPTNPLMMLLPLFLVGYLALPSLAVEMQEKRVENIDTIDLAARAAAPEDVQIWTTSSSTTTDIPPEFGSPTLGTSATKSIAHVTFTNRCGKSNCPSGEPHGSTGSNQAVLEAALLAVGAGVAIAIAFVV